jgi:serine/threonine protein kinase
MLKRRLVGDRYLLPPGEQLRGDRPYSIEAQLGGGSFSAGYRARGEGGQTCFVKEFLPPRFPSEREEIRRIFAQECDVLRRIGNYELCPRLWEAFETCGFQYLVQDYIPGQDLESLLSARTQFDEDTLVRWSLCLCHALAFLHSRSVVHHDMKPANIRMNADGDPMILDFGAARWYRTADERSDVLYGTEGYLAPEYASASGEDLATGMRMDIFALGRILVEMMVGERMTQAEIDRRHDQIYGSILHSKTLDIGFVRAVFRSVSYNPQARYANAIEMEKDLVQSAPPIPRRRPDAIDFGIAADTRLREATITVYNVGGGQLSGEVSTDAEWLEVSAEGVETARRQPLTRNRQTIRVIAHPDRLPPGARVEGRVIVSAISGSIASRVRFRRAVDPSLLSVQPAHLSLQAAAGEEARGTLRFRNRGSAPARVRVTPPALPGAAVAPEVFDIPANGQIEVVVSIPPGDDQAAADASVGWSIEGDERPAIPVELRRRGGVVSNVARGLRLGRRR